ncbi:MAG: hypothetical protein LAO56_07675 [Acidobacteriia bacterium]|nr:hypothetical protein [Terriglobia bacterium]
MLVSASILLVAVVSLASRTMAGEPEKEKPYALIFGTVWDPEGHPVYGVRVKIRRADQKKARWEVYSNHVGEFAQRLPPDKADYIVWADLKDYKLPSGKHLKGGTEVTVHIEDIAIRYEIGLHLTW